MKQKTKTWMAVLALTFISLCSFAQDEQQTATPRWVSDKGYWVVESNIHAPLNHIIRFYDNNDVLIYKETITGIKLNPAKRKVRMKLKKVLDASVLAWEKNKQPEENKDYVASIL
ncbi:MAG: hypothetical protein JNK14_04050 [Chitinophagaceae bacterium]|nr:hypothetical protein [Chitinophagaceae bacterium]